jgi:hypothetical protein
MCRCAIVISASALRCVRVDVYAAKRETPSTAPASEHVSAGGVAEAISFEQQRAQRA